MHITHEEFEKVTSGSQGSLYIILFPFFQSFLCPNVHVLFVIHVDHDCLF